MNMEKVVHSDESDSGLLMGTFGGKMHLTAPIVHSSEQRTSGTRPAKIGPSESSRPNREEKIEHMPKTV
jgi:hypothetical protein